MTVRELSETLAADVVYTPDGEEPILVAYTSDLLSDVMAHAPAECVLITIQNHLNTVAVATLVNARAILVCHAREIPPAMQECAQAERIALLRTSLDQFTASCRIGALLAGGRPDAL